MEGWMSQSAGMFLIWEAEGEWGRKNMVKESSTKMTPIFFEICQDYSKEDEMEFLKTEAKV